MFDFIVLGGGSAGCALAARLSEDPGTRVCLAEAGGSDAHFWIRTPLGYGLLFDNPALNWMYETAPEPGLNGARIFQPRGRVLGGTGSINGMVYIRGQREDFDGWAAEGNIGWGYDDLLPYFRRAERNSRGVSAFHGDGGPMAVSDPPQHPLCDAFIAAGAEAGYRVNTDFNGPAQEGFGYNQLMVGGGRRSSSASGHLRQARKRPNLTVMLDTVVDRLVLDGARVTGVHVRRGGTGQVLTAAREIILCGGVYGSPLILQRSGIGNATDLARIGVAPQHVLPGVGCNLQDHFTVAMLHNCLQQVTINDHYNSLPRRAAMGLRYLLNRSGPMAGNASFCGGYIRVGEGADRPDVKFNLALWGRAANQRSREKLGLLSQSSFTASFVLLRPANRGTVTATSADPEAAPDIRFNFLQDESDGRLAVAALKRLRQVLAMPAMQPFAGAELQPGPGITSDDDLLEAIRSRGRSNQHGCGTCRMGSDAMAVVDHRLRVHGIAGLRIADAAIMPNVVSGNTNATVVAIAEKAADLIRSPP